MCLQVTLTSQCVCPMLGLLFWWRVFLSVGIHIRLCLVCMKNKMAKLCGYILKLKLFGKPSNWCFHYLMIHLDKTPNKPSETWLPGCNLQRCHFSHWRRTSASVNLNFLYEPIHPTCKAQSNICKKFHNKPRESHFVTISFLLILFGRQNKASQVPFIWKSDFC